MNRVSHGALDYTDDDLYTYEGDPFTGIAVFYDDKDAIKAEHEYREGMRWGLSKGWFMPGCLRYEEEWGQGLLHGLRREWHTTGQVAAEEMFEYGIRLRGQRWDETGSPIEDFQLKDTDPDFDTLHMYRTAYRKAGLNQPSSPSREPTVD